MRKIHWIMIFIIVLFPLIGILFYQHLPEQMGTHWGSTPEPDEYMDKFPGTFGAAIILIIVATSLLAVNLVLTNIFTKAYSSPKPTQFIDCFTISLSLFLLASYIAVLTWNVRADYSVPRFMNISGVVLIVVLLAVTIYIVLRKSQVPEKQIDVKTDYDLSKNEYKDGLIEIAGDTIVFKNYYFPAGSKSIKLSEVKYIEEKQPTLWTGKWRLHGTAFFRTWFPADYDRPKRNKIFVMKVNGKWMRIGFTAKDSNAVSQIFRNKGLLHQ